MIDDGLVDLFVGYASNARLHEQDPKLNVIELPPKFAPRIEYGVALRTGASEPVRELRDLLLSPYGQNLCEANGFQQV